MTNTADDVQKRLIVNLHETIRRKNAQIAELTADNDRLRLQNGEQADEITTLQTIVDCMLDEIEAAKQQEIAAQAVNMTLALHLDTVPRE